MRTGKKKFLRMLQKGTGKTAALLLAAAVLGSNFNIGMAGNAGTEAKAAFRIMDDEDDDSEYSDDPNDPDNFSDPNDPDDPDESDDPNESDSEETEDDTEDSSDYSSLWAPQVTSIKNVNKTSVKLSWNAVYGAKKYAVQYALNEKFTKSVKKVTVTKKTCTVKKLKQGKTYYFRVCGVDSKGNAGSFSETKTVFVMGNLKTIKITSKKNLMSLQEELDKALANPKLKYEITLPKGKYTIERSLHVYSNTTLILKGVTITRKSLEGAMFLFGDGYGGKYSMGKNITLKGGVLHGGTGSNKADICCFTHIQNITFDGITFKYLPKKKLRPGMKNTHMIEFAGCKKVMIKNCKFYNNKNCLDNNEAVQLESLYPAQAGTTSAYFGKRDGTQCSNITIKKCLFSGFAYGCGSNHLNPKDHFKNIKILNNTFIGAKKYAICLFGYRNVLIKGNKLKNSGSLVQNQNSTGVKIIK